MERFVTTTDVLVAVLLFWNSLLAFLFLRQKKKYNWLSALGLPVLAIYWIGILMFSESLEVKVFVSVLLLSSLIIRFLILRKKPASNNLTR